MNNKGKAAAAILAMMLVFTGCSAEAASVTSQDTSAQVTSSEASAGAGNSEMFTERDLSGDYDESEAAVITLSGAAAQVTAGSSSSAAQAAAAAVSVDGSTITISAEGVYIVSGTLTDGMIIVDADDTAKVQIVLDNASVTSSTSAALYVKSADKVFVTTADGTQNTLANGGTFTAIDDSNIDGAVFAKDDITFNGNGTLTVTSPAEHGIVGKDDVKLAGGTINISATDHGVQANDSVRVAEADITITGCYEGIEAVDILICGGTIDITAQDDGLNAAGGTDCSIVISGGNTHLRAGGDAIDSNGSVEISGGYTVTEGPSAGDTSVLDFNSTAAVIGGTFIGTGGAGMAENFSSAENQGVITVSVGSQSAGQTVTLKDASGNVIAEVTPELDYAVVYISTPEVTQGGTYTLTAGSYSETIELSSSIYSSISGGMGGMKRGMGSAPMDGGMRGQRPEMNGQRPEMGGQREQQGFGGQSKNG